MPSELGTRMRPLVKGPMTTQHLMRWSAAIENWHRIHYDRPFAVDHDGLPDLLVNGSWKQHVLVQLLKDWAGPSGWVAELEFQYRSADLRGDTITAFGETTGWQEHDDVRVAQCVIGMRNQRGEHSTTGTAVVVLPGPGVPARVARTALAGRQLPAVDPHGRQAGEYVSAGMLTRIGVPGTPVSAPEPVDAGAVRRIAQAIMDDDPAYYDPARAADAGFESVVAPPLFPLHIHRRHAGQPDPLRLAIEVPDSDGAGDVITKHGLPPLDVGLPRLLNGGNQVQVFDLARIGDMLQSTSSISDLREKAGRSGPMVFVKVDTEYRAVNRGALLLRSRQTYVYR
ncbi:FAS1-like dehydratase domain-containing protein [Dactylosporangium sp. CA-092794]|uniref:FAS1-like dehydratase domain-containing protein n=1 Tax=Dactylosporangium sp. CA-092794 TaxID=3239929 RepID=UPI003D915981